jgi:hypothetical protein
MNTASTQIWYENLPSDKSWIRLWSDYTICGRCRGIRRFEGACGICGDPPFDFTPQLIRDNNDKEHQVGPAFMGAEGRYEDYVYLEMMQREWNRPIATDDSFSGTPLGSRPSLRASIVLLFWSYFETRIDRLLRAALAEIPNRLLDDTLRRYSMIGVRLNDFYRIAFDSTYKKDLEDLGHAEVWSHLAQVQEHRNQFAHGNPQSIDDNLVKLVVEKLKVEHEAWIAVFNKRATRIV